MTTDTTTTTTTETLDAIDAARRELADLRRDLRDHELYMARHKARVELAAEGRNEGERKARAVLLLAEDPDHEAERIAWEAVTARIAEVETRVERWRRERDDRRWAIRERAIAAVEVGAWLNLGE